MTPDELADRMDEARLRVWLAAMNLEWWAAHVADRPFDPGRQTADAGSRLTGDAARKLARARDPIPYP